MDYWYIEVNHDPLVDYDNDRRPSLLDKDSDNDDLKDGGASPSPGGGVSEQPGERTFGTDPSLPDTDFDGLTDREEVGWDIFQYKIWCNSRPPTYILWHGVKTRGYHTVKTAAGRYEGYCKEICFLTEASPAKFECQWEKMDYLMVKSLNMALTP